MNTKVFSGNHIYFETACLPHHGHLCTSNSLSLPLQGAEDINGEFYVKETQNGTIMFESVAFPGKYAHIHHGEGKKKYQCVNSLSTRW